MDDTQVGWIAAIIIGGVAGWLAEQFMTTTSTPFIPLHAARAVAKLCGGLYA